MPDAQVIEPTPEQRRLERQLLLSVLPPVAAAGISTIGGYTVAHWIAATASKRAGYIVSAVALVLCAASALLAASAQRKLGNGGETQPERARQLFMAGLGLLLSAMSAILVFAGILVLAVLRPND